MSDDHLRALQTGLLSEAIDIMWSLREHGGLPDSHTFHGQPCMEQDQHGDVAGWIPVFESSSDTSEQSTL